MRAEGVEFFPEEIEYLANKILDRSYSFEDAYKYCRATIARKARDKILVAKWTAALAWIEDFEANFERAEQGSRVRD